MAKADSVVKIIGTLGDITFVNSKNDGIYARAKRGTYKKISLAEGMKESSKVQAEVNLKAKLIFDAVKGFVPGFKDGKLWTRLLSVFRQQKKMGKSYSYSGFNGMEMRTDYPSSKHGSFHLTKDVEAGLLLRYQLFKKDSYRLRLLRIASDQDLSQSHSVETLTFDLLDGAQKGEIPFGFSELTAGVQTLYVLHCEQLINGEPSGLLRSKAVQFLTAGEGV